jgi:hypothetical protein
LKIENAKREREGFPCTVPFFIFNFQFSISRYFFTGSQDDGE